MNTLFSYAQTITKSDTVDAEFLIEAIFCGGAGNINVVMMDGTTVLLTACLAGHIYPIRCRRVHSTSTTASAMVALHSGKRTVDSLGAGQTIGI
jgi:hypothetical protein